MGRLFGILTIMNQIPILFILFFASDLVAQDTETSKSYYIFSEKQDKTLINNTGDKRYFQMVIQRKRQRLCSRCDE